MLTFVRYVFDAENTTEEEDVELIFEFERLSEHPSGSDLIYYPNKNRPDPPEGIVQEVKEWRAQQGKTGFKVG